MTQATRKVGEPRVSLPNGDTVNLRELYALLEGFKDVMEERDRRYVEGMAAASKAVDTAFKNSQTAIDKADAARSIHDAAVNEWRQQYNAQENKFLPKVEYDNKMRDVAALLERLGSDMTAFPSKTEVSGKFDVHESRFATVEGRVQTLETARSEDLGRKAEAQGSKTESNDSAKLMLTGIGIAFSAGIGAVGLILSLSK